MSKYQCRGPKVGDLLNLPDPPWAKIIRALNLRTNHIPNGRATDDRVAIQCRELNRRQEGKGEYPRVYCGRPLDEIIARAEPGTDNDAECPACGVRFSFTRGEVL